ncbi:MAG TPA: hypothetical protein VF668_01225 [Pyrinomonadaceae bacterium]|jgi:3'-phosphoadenosine 5'-phosphosulfate sulfotransferase (PAPS reductase)/FAD synthetase
MKALGRKQSADNADFVALAQGIEQRVTRAEIDNLVDRTVDEIRRVAGDKRAAYAWSGGKDSIALGGVCRLAGVTPCLLGMTYLEYPQFLAWLTDNMPDELTVINTGQDLNWLASNLSMLFPQDAATAARWFKIVQHKAQEVYYHDEELDMIVLGRRRADGNYCGAPGENVYTSKGVTRYSPIWQWRHEEVIAFNHYYGLPCPPIYSWPNGFVVGTGSWPARQYTGSIENGWREVFSIDPSVVEFAATRIESAREFLARKRG